MATKSIYKNLRLKNRSLCRAFVTALENSEKMGAIDVKYTKSVRDIKDPAIIRSLLRD